MGEFDSGTILDNGFRAEHFEFYDLTTSQPVVHSPFPGTCDPGVELAPYGVLEMVSSKPRETRQLLEDVSPLSDPVRMLENGHEYLLKLKPQTVWSYEGTKEDLFKGKEYLTEEEMPEGMMVTLACDDELVLKVEA